MTCIVGYVNTEGVYIGGDSLGIDEDYGKEVRLDTKVFKKGSMIFGFTDSFRMGQIIRYCLDIPEHHENKSIESYMCCEFVDAVMKCFKDKHYATIDDNVMSGGQFMIGYRGKLISIGEDFQIGLVNENYQAIGSGASYALGALHVINRIKLKPENRIIKALEAASKHCASVGPPFKIVSLKNK